MLRIEAIGNAIPHSLPCDPSAVFMPGMLAEIVAIGNQIMVTVSNGTAPIGIIDDIKTKAFTNISWNETVIVPCKGVPNQQGAIVTPIDMNVALNKPNIIKSSFLSTVNCVLNANNGIVTFLAGTPLNIDLTGSGVPNGIKALVNYTYFVANIPGDDSTMGSGRVTIWYQRGFFQTDQYETNQQYPLRANLFCSEVGLFTTRKSSANIPSIAIVTASPSSVNPYLGLLYL